jgi:hypothetical protein
MLCLVTTAFLYRRRSRARTLAFEIFSGDKIVIEHYLKLFDRVQLGGNNMGSFVAPQAAEISHGCGVKTMTKSEYSQPSAGGKGPAKRPIAVGANPNPGKASRNFVWLPYGEGAANYAVPHGMDVLSGLFSGCYMISYNVPGGERRVAHIANPGAIDFWNRQVAAQGYFNLRGFQPYIESADAPAIEASKKAHLGDSVPGVLGLVTGDGRLFSIVAWQHREETNFWRIESVTPKPSLPWNNLGNLFRLLTVR